MSNTIPSDAHAINDPGHVTDHDNMADVLGLTVQTIAQAMGTFNSPPAGNAANITAMENFIETGSSFNGLKFLTGGGSITTSTISTAQSENYQGLFLDPNCIWDMSGLVIGGSNTVSNFIIESRMMGSIGYNAKVNYGTTGYIKTDTPNGGVIPTDGVQVYTNSTTSHPVQGVVFRNCVFVGQNPTSVVHFGAGIKRCGLEDCLVYNTSTATINVGTASNGTAVSTFTTGSPGTITASGTIPTGTGAGDFPSTGGYLIVPVAIAITGVFAGLAIIKYTGITGSTFTGCVTIQQTSGGTLSTTVPLSQMQLLGAAFIIDTSLTSAGSLDTEDQFFDHVSFASEYGIGIGIDLFGTAQHTNDTSWNDITTSVLNGPCSIVNACVQGNTAGSNHSFINWFDRSDGPLATFVTQVWNAGGSLIMWGGEDLNQNTTNAYNSCTYLLDRANSCVVLANRALGGQYPIVMINGQIKSMGRNKWNGPFLINGGTLDLSDPAGAYDPSTNPVVLYFPTGNTATLLLSGQYSPGAAPTIGTGTGYGTAAHTYTSSWTGS